LPGPPTGTVTFLFTDIEGSTALLQRLGDRHYADVLAQHQRLLRDAFAQGNGQEIDTQGDAFLVAFSRARDALGTAVAAQQALLKHIWPDGEAPLVRMGLHTGEPVSETGGYIGLDVHRAARICAAGHGGQILLSQAVGVLAAPNLPLGVSLRDLGPHRLKDLREPEHLFQVVHPDLPADFPRLKSLDVLPNNLPVQVTSFIGREWEKAEVRRLLSVSRFLTLTGSGGEGKTRLALQVAAEVLEEFPDGAWLVELAALSDPSLVPKSVASALGVPEQPGRVLTDTLADFLRGKSVLVILDNCEHLVEACAHLTDALLRACLNLRILATSREALGVTGETTWRVPSLSHPDPQNLPPLDRFVQYEAVRLFIDRAVAREPQFAVTRSNAPAVAQVCHRLDGIPLAIELAAARVKVLTVEQIAARLHDRFLVLTGGSRTALPRHQTLRAAMDWSYDLLSDRERTMLRRLSVFSGGWTLEASEAVCSGGVEAADIVDMLMQLVDKSLVVAETLGTEARYRMLETVREYGRDRLQEAEEADDAKRRHRDWYLALAEQAAPELWGPQQAQWLERLETEHDNLRAALGWSNVEKDGAEAGLRLTGALHIFWIRRGHWSEGRAWLNSALTRDAEVPPSVLPSALHGATNLAWRQGDFALARTLGEKGLALCRELADMKTGAWFLFRLGQVAMRQGEYKRATALFEKSLNFSNELGQKSLSPIVLAELGHTARRQRHYDRAAELYAKSLVLLRERGDKWHIALLYRSLGNLAVDQGDYGQAAAFFAKSLDLCAELGDRWISEQCLEGWARMASATGHYEQTARLFGAAEALRETLGFRFSTAERTDHDQCAVSTRTAIGDAAFAAAWAEGRAMTLEQAIEYAIAEIE
jgi:predicted ATPase/class 3 adenylate cyclase